MPTFTQAVRRLRAQGILPASRPVSVRNLHHQFLPLKRGSARSLLLTMLANYRVQGGGSPHPYYRRSMPAPQNLMNFSGDTVHIDFANTNVHMPAYPPEPVKLSDFTSRFDARAAAAVSNATGLGIGVRVFPSGEPSTELLEEKEYGDEAPTIYIPKGKCLAALAFPDYFPDVHADGLRPMVSEAILAASPGWCGTFGPGVDSFFDVAFGNPPEGNYDMSQMHLLQIAYRYYDELSPEARDRLIQVLLATGRIHRPDAEDVVTSGKVPEDWSRAGHVHAAHIKIRIGETENHILTIHTARYLTNQLLYQQDLVDKRDSTDRDNRHNGDGRRPSCTELMLYLLQGILRDDFSEYNAKPYQNETRSALLNLCSYAYDHEVRLAARMVLDYISAHIAVSSCDLRRMVPFRRLNKNEHVTRLSGVETDYMGVGLLDTSLGADPMSEPFAIQAGNTRAYATPNFTLFPPDFRWAARPWNWSIASDGGPAVAEALSDYRLPPPIHALFVNDSHRRFFQRLHRVKRFDEVEGAGALDEDARGISGRNADNMEIYCGSPSYLITAGGAPSSFAIDPGPSLLVEEGRKKSEQQLGVAVPTSFMPTGIIDPGTQNSAKDLIQFGAFSEGFSFVQDGELVQSSPTVANYGVAPDFACGHKMNLPSWVLGDGQADGQFLFINRGSPVPLPNVVTEPPGFYLAIFNEGEFPFLEAFDTWLHRDVTFQDFKRRVKETNQNIRIENNVPFSYTTQNGNRLLCVIWKDGKRENDAVHGARILSIEYGAGNPVVRDPHDRLGDAGNITDRFLNGTILNSTGEAKIEISNPSFESPGTIALDMDDQWHPKRTSETGEVEEAGFNNEVWVNFGYDGPSEGDFFRPFNNIAAAAAAVADGGVIKIVPGWTTEKPSFLRKKRIRLVAPIGGVTIGAH